MVIHQNLIIMLSFLFGYCFAGNLLTVETQGGKVRGFYKQTVKSKRYIAFEGIPYAKPPIGNLRFEPPQPFGKWNGVLNANTTYICSQVLFVQNLKLGQEDCLYLNVYVPKETIDANANLSVIVNIHGGSFMILSAKLGAGEDFVMDRDVIYVNLNYRLGVLGFLSTDDETVPGNMGLKDQNVAMKWVKDNIKYFGGNPDSITLIGCSAGGASVHYHYLSPLSRGLFHRGMSQSGTTFNTWAFIQKPKERLTVLANHLNCSQMSGKTVIDCLKYLPVKDILKAQMKLFKVASTYPTTLFGPVIDKGPNAFLPDHPYKLISSGNFTQVPWITSNTIDEGVYPILPIVILNKLQEFDEKWNDQLPYVLNYAQSANKTDWPIISKKIRDYYLEDKPATRALSELVKLCSDRYFLYDTYRALKLHTQNSVAPVYYYRYSFDDGIPTMGVKGVAHADDSKIVFRMINVSRKLPEKTAAMRDTLLDMIYNYATTGKPTINNQEFPAFKKSAGSLLINIKSSNSVTIEKFKELESDSFWYKLPIIENEKLFTS
ncbi:venom carboxylesterase-6 isoform X2 [Agrilus planipennis]|uniref:Carboxylic ester hydrolase n=1 Tax=Agrilus planipennis TaxID=224129 RepID=A0A1W4WYD0_AGRPL|nr:venom carboxylesterase-6 isoform X2 [Agrilus planipennis]